MSDNKDFFKKQTDSSRVKAAIISEYFPQYCKIISRRHTPQRFGYFDKSTEGSVPVCTTRRKVRRINP